MYRYNNNNARKLLNIFRQTILVEMMGMKVILEMAQMTQAVEKTGWRSMTSLPEMTERSIMVSITNITEGDPYSVRPDLPDWVSGGVSVSFIVSVIISVPPTPSSLCSW